LWNIPTNEQLDKIPRLHESEGTALDEIIIHLHFFIFGSDWFIAEYDGDDLFFGFACLDEDYINAEWGYVGFQDLKELNIYGIEIDHDLYWKPRTAGEIDLIKKCINSGCNKKRKGVKIMKVDRVENWRKFSAHMEAYIKEQTVEKYKMDQSGASFDLMSISKPIICVWNILRYALRMWNGKQKTHDIEKIAHYAEMSWTMNDTDFE